MQDISSLILRMAREDPAWGYTRLQGPLKNLGHAVVQSTVAKVLKHNGIPPAPERPSSWRTFLRAHWGRDRGADFFTSEIWTPRGLITSYTLFVIAGSRGGLDTDPGWVVHGAGGALRRSRSRADSLQAKLHQDLPDVLDIGDGRERRTWGIVNSGLCLLVAWSLESLLQQRQADFR